MADQQDPSKMTDEELDKALAPEEVELEEAQEEPDELETPEELQEEAEPEEVEEPDEAEEEPKTSRRAEKRALQIHDLLEQVKNESKRAQPQPDFSGEMDYGQTLDADPEVLKKLQDDRAKAATSAYQQGLEQTKSIQFETRLEVDAPRVAQKYPQLDTESDKFNPALATAVNTMYLSAVGYDFETGRVRDPNLRYAPYVSAIYELANEIAGEKTEGARKNIVKQAAKTGLRPDGSRAKKMNLNKPPEQMTDEELDAVINMSIPSH